MLPSSLFRKATHQTRNRCRRTGNKIKIAFQQGRFQIMGLNDWRTYLRDPYHLLLVIPWAGFVGIMAVGYVIINVPFALAYMAGGDCIENARPGSFWDAFFFSVHTLSTIGYGSMYPKTLYAHWLVTFESFVGLFSVALITGLAFARFAQPTARVIFSQVMTIHLYNGVPTLTLRTANQRRNQILEAQLRLYLMRDEISREGEFMRRLYELKLMRSRTPAFSLSWTVMHPMDKDSPLFGATPESLEKTKVTAIASLTGIDETVGQAIHARYTYGVEEILWNQRFVDIIHEAPDGHRYIDYTHFHEVTPSPVPIPR